MQELVALAYKSIAVRRPTSADLEALLLSARSFNSSVGVTGALFHHAGRFFQYIEGPAQGLSQAYQRIEESQLHSDLIELAHQPIATRQFESWHMAFCEPPGSALQELSNNTWEESMPITRNSFDRSEHLEMVLHYWNRWSADQPGPLRGEP